MRTHRGRMTVHHKVCMVAPIAVATMLVLATDGARPYRTSATGGAIETFAWADAFVVALLAVGALFATRGIHRWLVKKDIARVSEDLHDLGRHRMAAIVATFGHWLHPKDPRYRFFRGLARQERCLWKGALKDLVWSTQNLRDSEHKAISAYYAACVAARMDHPGIAREMLAIAARIDELFLQDARSEPALRRLAGGSGSRSG